MSAHIHLTTLLCILYFSSFEFISCQQRIRYRDDRRFEDDRSGNNKPGDVNEPPIVDGSYFDINKDDGDGLQRPSGSSGFDWTGRRRVTTTSARQSQSQSSPQQPTYTRTVYSRQNTTNRLYPTTYKNTTIRRTSYRRPYQSLYNTSLDTQSPVPSRSSISSSIDALLNNQSSTEYRGGTYTYHSRRQNVSTATGHTSVINGQRVQTPLLWYNRTWHWSTNRTREYDPDLDGTTVSSKIEHETEHVVTHRPSACDCHSIGSLDNHCDPQTGQCKCRPGTYGRQCDECQPGFWNYPNCQRCDCNGHTDLCDSKTGVCINCRDYTTGPQCERCERGYYGSPQLVNEVSIPCRECPCPGISGSGMTHADTCDLDPRTKNVICRCKIGYTGERCDRCDNNYWGEAAVPGGECRQCECSNNIDISQLGNCDTRTGECLKCLYNTGGPKCEQCVAGYWGDATRQQCAECVCNPLGTNQAVGFCDQITGQCPCLPNVVGKACDRCAINHWKIASGEGCEACDCDPLGAYNLKCNEFDGQCHCKPGHGGRQCNECQPNFWGDPRFQCHQCECNPSGSSTLQCHKKDGSCVCIDGISGPRCDRCARGYTGRAPHCEPCGECFDNWDAILTTLKEHTLSLIEKAKILKQTGTSGAYTNEFNEIENNLNEIEAILEGQNVTDADVSTIGEMIEQVRRNLTETQNILTGFENHMSNINDRIIRANLNLTDLRRKSQGLQFQAEALKENATALQEANVEGAFNITKDAQRRSKASEQRIRDTVPIVYASEHKRRSTERLLEQVTGRYNASYNDNEAALGEIGRQIAGLEGRIPNINELVCDGRATVSSCDNLCGGAGCNKCGGLSCTQGATTKADNALDLANKSDSAVREKEMKARDELTRIIEARQKSDEALREAKAAYERAITAKNTSEETSVEVQDLLDRIEEFLREEASRPAEIRVLAEECLQLEISLKPEQIQELAQQINDTIRGLTDITKILMETAGDLANANRLKERADRAKIRADGILGQAEEVKNALREAADAQRKAEAAIAKANGDINGATGDLTQIESETEEASANADKASTGIAELQSRLEELQKSYTRNELDIRKAETEAQRAGKDAENVDQDARELERKFDEASRQLEDKASASGAVKERAESLRERAKKLAENANAKLGTLQEIEDGFNDNESRLKDYQKIIDDLNEQMMNHLQFIESRSNHYRNCQA